MSRAKKPRTESGGSGRGARRLLVVVLTLAAAAGLVWGVARLGDLARSGLGPRDRYAVRFADIECDAPPGLDRPTFLSEVRYVADLPETIQALDPELSEKLKAAFAAHPWVASFDGTTVDAEHHVRVKLRFRTPAVAVRTPGGVRVVDASGVLLPPEAKADGLPELVSPARPSVAAGQVWNDPDLKRALELVEAHHPRSIEKTAKGWRLTTADGKTLSVGP